MKINFKALLFSLILCLGAGFIGSVFTTPAIGTWYATLNKPTFSPPNYIFAPVWTTLYILMGISFYLVLVSKVKEKQTAIVLFAIQLILNVLWSVIFFGLHSPLGALIAIVLLWISILMTIVKFYKISKPAAYLMIPYILWVSFATLLNISIVLLNP